MCFNQFILQIIILVIFFCLFILHIFDPLFLYLFILLTSNLPNPQDFFFFDFLQYICHQYFQFFLLSPQSSQNKPHMPYTILFQNLSQQTIQQLTQFPVDCGCLVFKRHKIESNQSSMIDTEYEQVFLKIQIRKNYVLHVKLQDDTIISGFECDINTTFKLIRAMTADSQQVGQLLGIQFRSQKFNKKNVFLYLPEQNKKFHAQKLQKLAQNLGRKYIIQDGFHDIYRAIKKIGKGVTASVYKALRLTDKKEVAVKSFKKQLYYQIDNGRGKAAFQKQFKAMTQVDSSYLCKLISVYESDNSIYIVMELLTRSLYSYLKINGFPNLPTSKQIMVKLLIGLGQLHTKKLMHRDLKLQNIMIIEKQSQVEPIIIDFGLAQYYNNAQFLYIKCGTPGYVAPQILNLKQNQIPSPPYSFKCDIFSMGVIFYILLTSKTVFEGNDQREVVRKNRQCEIDYDFSSQKQKKLTVEMKDLLRKMLAKDPNDRATVEQLLSHQFFKQVQFLKQFQTRITSISVQQTDDKDNIISQK